MPEDDRGQIINVFKMELRPAQSSHGHIEWRDWVEGVSGLLLLLPFDSYSQHFRYRATIQTEIGCLENGLVKGLYGATLLLVLCLQKPIFKLPLV